MKTSENKITLYPSNWLYNAGVVGFLRVLEFADKSKLEEISQREYLFITEEELNKVKEAYWEFGIIHLLSNKDIIEDVIKKHWKKFSKKKDLPSAIDEKLNQLEMELDIFQTKNLIEFKNNLGDLADELKIKYLNILKNIVHEGRTKNKEILEKFITYLENNLTKNKIESVLKDILKDKLGSKDCILANHPFFNPAKEISWAEEKLRELIEEKIKGFIKNTNNLNSSIHCKICGLPYKSSTHYDLSTDLFSRSYFSFMGASYEKVPNFFFYYQQDIIICPFCQFLFILSPFGLPPDQNEFVNVPSIKALYYLNKLLLKLKKIETYKTLEPNERLETLISEAILNYKFLEGAWVLQNVELIQIERGEQPKVYTLPVSRTSAELIIREDVRKSLANLKGQITIVKKEENSLKIFAQREGIKRFLTGGEGSLVDLCYFALKNDQAKETSFNLAKLEKIRIDYKKERRFKMIENELIEVWNMGQKLKEEKFDKNLKYELLSASLIEEKERLLEYLSEIEKRNKIPGKLAELREFINTKNTLDLREIILAFIAGYKSDKVLTFEDILENPLKVFWNEGKEIGKMEEDIESKVNKYVFRILSKIRVGDRNGTIFEILKLYLLYEKPVPIYLSELFRDKTDIEKFKLFAYSFLSGFIGEDEKEIYDIMYEMEKIGENVIEESLEDRIKKYGYRLLSLIRAGLRSEFAYEIIKLYAQAKEKIPHIFIEILDPFKSTAEFQSLAYGILSGYLKNK